MKNNKFSTTLFLLSSLKKHYIYTLILCISIIGVSLASLLPSLVLQNMIDNFINISIKTNTLDNSKLLTYTLVYFFSYVLMFSFTILENYILDIIGQKMIKELRYIMMEKSNKIKASYYRHTGTGITTSRIIDDVSSVETVFSDGLVSMIVSLFKIVAVVISIFVFNYILGLLVLIIIPIIYFISNFFRKQILKNQIQSRKIRNDLTNTLSESVSNIQTLINTQKRDFKESQFKNNLIEDVKVSKKSGIYDSIFSPIVMIIRSFVIGAVCLLVSYSLTNGNDIIGISVGSFSACISLISNIFAPIQELGMQLQVLQVSISGIKRIDDFMNLDEDNKKDESLTSEKVLNTNLEYPALEVKNLSFKYLDGDNYIFNNVSFKINKNEKVTIKGRTGIGKTTLFRLILSYEYPTSGLILINNYDTKLIPDTYKREIFGYVNQNFSPILGTIKDQLTLKDESISLEDVIAACKKVDIDSYIQSNIKNGYDATFKIEDFSNGQLQLLNLARALIKNPKILLLDEMSANLDSKTEKIIIDTLTKESKDKTVISISHRLSNMLGFNKTIEVNQEGVKISSN